MKHYTVRSDSFTTLSFTTMDRNNNVLSYLKYKKDIITVSSNCN